MSPRRVLALSFLGATLAGAILGMGAAKASPLDQYVIDNAPVVCTMLDDNPATDGVADVGTALMGKGLTAEQAGEVVARAVAGWCPDHMEQVQAFIAKYGQARQILR